MSYQLPDDDGKVTRLHSPSFRFVLFVFMEQYSYLLWDEFCIELSRAENSLPDMLAFCLGELEGFEGKENKTCPIIIKNGRAHVRLDFWGTVDHQRNHSIENAAIRTSLSPWNILMAIWLSSDFSCLTWPNKALHFLTDDEWQTQSHIRYVCVNVCHELETWKLLLCRRMKCVHNNVICEIVGLSEDPLDELESHFVSSSDQESVCQCSSCAGSILVIIVYVGQIPLYWGFFSPQVRVRVICINPNKPSACPYLHKSVSILLLPDFLQQRTQPNSMCCSLPVRIMAYGVVDK